ncbi:Pimeloyl-ACP methyl ester carboxylesterase [Nakamurella panacisegetis]|uniref:Pimeloyl-ACP methyl ester carboxylesterase n=1 Tax=Nakamurella panacisegetis TaxID=1090615 RepID=A0A1H0P3N2_9ACTN|nr:alpha/beta hydrolase [Nakamurella panacisegetis]SDO99295.1 Pimeloyl-ACP methyl ester carboxylesterase [Nakamurella panacisegetis]
MSTWGKIIGAASITTGVVAAAALGGVTAQRRAIRKYRASDGADAGYDALAADRTYSVLADDGVVLHIEEVGPESAPLTVIFGHGWTLRSGSWHYQRIGLGGKGFGTGGDGPAIRMVFYDQRSHGRSSRAGEGHSTMKDLAGDLAAVIATAAPTGPVVLIGHSMGGMALLTLAGLRPDLFAERVAGVGLVATSSRELSGPQVARSLMSSNSVALKLAGYAASRYPKLVERGRASSRDAVWLLTRALGFAQKDVPGELVDYLDEMISGTPVNVIAEFVPALMSLDQTASLTTLVDLPVVIICGDADLQTPLSRSLAIADALPNAELVVIPGTGHMVIMERPDEVNAALRRLLVRAMDHVQTATRNASGRRSG